MSSPRRPIPGPQRRDYDLQDDEEENSQDSVEQAALEAGHKDDNVFEQDSLMFDDMMDDDGLPVVDDDDDDVAPTGRGSDAPITSTELLLDETDSTLNTPFGSPLSAISNFSSIQKWTGEVKKMLLEDQKTTESRAKGWIYPSPETETTSRLPLEAGSDDSRRIGAEGLAEDVDQFICDSDFDIMPTAEELAEKYSNELIEKEKSILQKDSKIIELERAQRELKGTLEDCQKELRLKTESATSGVERLKRTLEEKDKCIMETSERLRKVAESYNSSEKRWKEQQDFLEKQIGKLKTQVEDNRTSMEEAQLQTELSKKEKQTLEQLLEQSKKDIEILKQQFVQEKEALENELENLKIEKSTLEKELLEEIESLKNKLTLSKQAVETALNEKETCRLELESEEEKNRILTLDLHEMKDNERIISQQQSEKLILEETVSYLKQEQEKLQEMFSNEKYELGLEIQTLKEELEEAKQQSDEVTPVNFFRQDNDATDSAWLDTKKSMEDRIAELELEKGNLLLQLVDIDEQQESRRDAESNLENQLEQLESVKQALKQSEERMTCLERELEESKVRDSQRIETAMNTIAWEEKFELLQKENASLVSDLDTQRKSADELSCRYEELERKCTELEMNKPTIENLLELDKCDGWSDDTPQLPDEGDAPQLPDEGFTEDPQITELKEALEEKQREIELFYQTQKDLEDKLAQERQFVLEHKIRLEAANSAASISNDKFQECLKELETVRQELIEKSLQIAKSEQATGQKPVEGADGWADDAPVLLDEGFNEDNQLAELKVELKKKSDELGTTMEKCKSLEDKLKKASKALKQKNDKLAELKKRLGEESMSASVASTMDASVIVEEVVTKSSAYVCGSALAEEVETLKKQCEEKEYKIKELETVVKSLNECSLPPPSAQMPPMACDHQGFNTMLAQRDSEVVSLRNELSQLASSLDSKNEEVEQLMKACGDMQKSVDEKVEMLNDCVAKKDEEVRQAISQYEDILKDATLNVSHLTKELEEKIHEINVLQCQLQESQEQLLETQNEFETYKSADIQSGQLSLAEKDQKIEEHRLLADQLRYELNNVQAQLFESFNNNTLINEALDRAESEKKQLREESVCIQNEYGNKSRELQIQVSQLIDQLNERESAISVMEARLKESDDMVNKASNEIRFQLEEKTKALELAEQTLFVKTEENVKLEERMRDTEERFRLELENKTRQLEEHHRVALESYAMQTSEDLERTCEQLAKKNNESVELQEKCNYFQNQATKLQEDYNMKCAELTQKEQALSEIDTLKSAVQNLEGTIASYTHALNSANADLNAKSEEITNLQTICGQYEEKCFNSAVTQEDAQRALKETQASLAQSQHELSNYYNELQNSKIEIESLRTSCNEFQETASRLNDELRESKTEVGQHVSQLQNMSNQLARYHELEINLNKYLEDLNSATEELGKKNSELWELEKLSKSKDTQIQSLQANLASSRAEVVEKDIKITEISDYMAKLENDARQTLETRAQEEDSSSKYVKELVAELDEKNKEIGDLRFELDEGVLQERNLKKNLESKDQEIQQLRGEIDTRDRSIAELQQEVEHFTSLPTLSKEDEPLVQRLQYSEAEKVMLERKIDLLQVKLAEVEGSEVKCYEDFSRLKILRTELEMDNLRMSAELEQLRRSFQDGDNDPKYKSMENQIVLMSKTLEDRDKLCRDLMKNIGELQESHDALQVRINEFQVQQLPPHYFEGSLEATVLEQDRQIFSLRIDVDREKKIRELYEGLLFLATSKKQFDNSAKKSGAWFGFGDFFSSPSPPSPPRPPSSARSSVSSSMLAPPQPPSTPYFGASNPPFASTPARPITPISPATAFSSSLFDTSGQPQSLPFATQLPGHSSAEDIRPEFTMPSISPTNLA